MFLKKEVKKILIKGDLVSGSQADEAQFLQTQMLEESNKVNLNKKKHQKQKKSGWDGTNKRKEKQKKKREEKEKRKKKKYYIAGATVIEKYILWQMCV